MVYNSEGIKSRGLGQFTLYILATIKPPPLLLLKKGGRGIFSPFSMLILSKVRLSIGFKCSLGSGKVPAGARNS